MQPCFFSIEQQKYSSKANSRYFVVMRIIAFLFLGTIFFGCDAPHENVESYHDNGEVKELYAVLRETGNKDGEYQRFSEAGTLVESAWYKDGTMDGERKLFYENGKVEVIEHYHEGTFEGPYKYYYENGNLELEGNYVKGAMKGTWKHYYPEGQLEEKVEFENNEENGPFVEYYRNGNLKAEGSYYSGDNEHGLLKLYDEDGKLYRKMECDSGICHTTWLRADSTKTNIGENEG